MKAQPMSTGHLVGPHTLSTFVRSAFRRAVTRTPVAGRWRASRMFAALVAAALSTIAVGSRAGILLTNIHSFNVYTNGATPYSGVIQGSDGYFYGTTAYGGTNGNHGTVYKISPNGVLTSLYSFTGGNDGGNPIPGLVQASDGYFYGATYQQGANNFGTVFKISSTGVLTILYSFTGGSDGGNPDRPLVQGRDGNLYG